MVTFSDRRAADMIDRQWLKLNSCYTFVETRNIHWHSVQNEIVNVM